MKYGLTMPPAFNKREAEANREGGMAASTSTLLSRNHTSSSALASYTSASHTSHVRMEVDMVPPPPAPVGLTIGLEYYVDGVALPQIEALLEENTIGL
jgi:hypothetical protein